MTLCYIALGGNLGSVEDTIESAIQSLQIETRIKVNSVSSTYQTGPIGENAGSDFQNAALEIETDLDPIQLLDLLQTIETKFGRKRELHWGPRTLDLDLIFYGNQILETSRLTVPHPACWYRQFVLDPLVEIAADFVHPQKGITVDQLRSRLLKRPFRFSVAGANQSTRETLIAQLSKQFPQVEFSEWNDSPDDDLPEPTLLSWLGPGKSETPISSTFESLPLIPRLDASKTHVPIEQFLHDVLQAAAAEDPVD